MGSRSRPWCSAVGKPGVGKPSFFFGNPQKKEENNRLIPKQNIRRVEDVKTEIPKQLHQFLDPSASSRSWGITPVTMHQATGRTTSPPVTGQASLESG